MVQVGGECCCGLVGFVGADTNADQAEDRSNAASWEGQCGWSGIRRDCGEGSGRSGLQQDYIVDCLGQSDVE